MQTRDAVEGLHNFREFSQPPEWREIFSIYFVIEIDFLNTRAEQSYFLLANQNAHLTTHEPIKIRATKV